MTKSNKSKKLRKQAFHKVKLKLGRVIKKGNATDTTFKTKKIKIVGQFQQTSSEAEKEASKLQIVDTNINPLLLKLQHYSASTRLHTLISLKSALASNMHLIGSHIAPLMEHVPKLITDKEENVRRELCSILKIIFEHMTPTQFGPFLSIVVAHLCCGINHIETGIQLSALELFDILLQFYPEFLATSSSKLLESFLNLISFRYKNVIVKNDKSVSLELNKTPNNGGSSRGSGNKNQNGVLATDPSRKMSGFAWLHKVFKSLENMFRILASLKQVEADENCCQRVHRVSLADIKERRSITISNNIWIGIARSKCGSLYEIFDSLGHFNCIVGTVISLLQQGWMESLSQTNNSTMSSSFPIEVLDFRCCIVKIINSIWSCIDAMANEEGNVNIKSEFWQMHGNLVPMFFKHFPFSRLPDVSKKKLKHHNKDIGVELNIMLCDFVTSIDVHYPNQKLQSFIDKALQYLYENIEQCKGEIFRLALQIVARISSTRTSKRILKPMLHRLVTLNSELQAGSNKKRALLQKTLESFAFDKEFKHLHSSGAIKTWLKAICDELLSANQLTEFSLEVLGIVRRALPLAHEDVLSNVANSMPHLLEKVHQFDSIPIEALRTIFEYLYWVTEVSPQSFTALLQIYMQGKVPSEAFLYLLQILQSRYFKKDKDGNWSKYISSYLSFLLCVAGGISRIELQNLKAQHVINLTSNLKFLILNDGDNTTVYRHAISKVALNNLMQIAKQNEIQGIAEKFLIDVFNLFPIFNSSSCYCLINLIIELWEDSVPEVFIYHFSALCLNMLMLMMSSEVESFRWQILELVKRCLMIGRVQETIFHIISSAISEGEKEKCNLFGEVINFVSESVPYENLKLPLVNELLLQFERKNKDFTDEKWWSSVMYHINLRNDSN